MPHNKFGAKLKNKANWMSYYLDHSFQRTEFSSHRGNIDQNNNLLKESPEDEFINMGLMNKEGSIIGTRPYQ